MDRALDLKPEVTQGCGGFESRLRQELSTTEPPTAPWLLQVCVHLDGLNAKNTYHCWLYSV